MHAPPGARRGVEATPFLFRWREEIYHSDLTSTERHVLHVLSFHGDENGRDCFPSLASLARKTGHGRKTCWLALQRGLAAGWIAASGRINFDGSPAKGGRGHGDSSTVSYHLAIPGTGVVVTPLYESETGVVGTETGVVGAETGVVVTPNLIMTSPSTSSIAKNADDLFVKVIEVEAMRQTDARIAAGKVNASSRYGYAEKIARTLALKEGSKIRAAISAHHGATAAELAALIWHRGDDTTGRQRIEALQVDCAKDCTRVCYLGDEPAVCPERARQHVPPVPEIRQRGGFHAPAEPVRRLTNLPDVGKITLRESVLTGTLGAHQRWHLRRRIVNPSCPYCVPGANGRDTLAEALTPRESVTTGGFGAHVRWHRARGVTSPDCPHCLAAFTGGEPALSVAPFSPPNTGQRL